MPEKLVPVKGLLNTETNEITVTVDAGYIKAINTTIKATEAAAAADIAEGKKAYVNGVLITGTAT